MALPQVPTLAESGLANLEIASWFGLMAPTGTPSAVIARLNLETNRILASPAFAHRLDTEGGEAAPASAQEFGAFIRTEIERWAAIVRRSGAQLD
jgi:tripartite-type tricarboxylate transporter receptor subunit TctC